MESGGENSQQVASAWKRTSPVAAAAIQRTGKQVARLQPDAEMLGYLDRVPAGSSASAQRLLIGFICCPVSVEVGGGSGAAYPPSDVLLRISRWDERGCDGRMQQSLGEKRRGEERTN